MSNKHNRIARDPNYKFHSEWHRQKHMEARKARADGQVIANIMMVVIVVPCLLIILVANL